MKENSKLYSGDLSSWEINEPIDWSSIFKAAAYTGESLSDWQGSSVNKGSDMEVGLTKSRSANENIQK